MADNIKIIGKDDWLVFARRSDGTLVYNVVEGAGLWDDAPNHGDAEYGTPEHAEDWRFCMKVMEEMKSEIDWQTSDDQLIVTDEEFTQHTVSLIGEWR